MSKFGLEWNRIRALLRSKNMGFSTSRNKANSIKSFVHGHFNLIIFKKLEACFVYVNIFLVKYVPLYNINLIVLF